MPALYWTHSNEVSSGGYCTFCTTILNRGIGMLAMLPFDEWWDLLDVSTSGKDR